MVVGSGAAGRARRGERERGFFQLALHMFSRDKKAREGLEEIERKFDQLEHDFKMLKLEWEESYEKIASMLRKLGRRAQVLAEEDGKPLSPEERKLAERESVQAGAGAPITETQIAARLAVLKRRGMA